MSPQKTSTWANVKRHLAHLEKSELLEVLRDLYQLNADNKIFLTSRLTQTDISELAEPYRRAIRQEFNPDRGFPRLSLRSARKALNDFKKASSSQESIVDMMIYYVEQGVICTNNYGDIDEAFYSSLESVFADAIALVNQVKDPQITERFRGRFKRIISETSGIGWGFHDFLMDAYDSDYSPE